MDILVENLWKNFIDPDTHKFIGEKFESLVQKLLQRGFNGQWKATKKSWDGAHDFFEVTLKDNKRWAECKMYRKSLQTHIFAKTLILAVNKEVDVILIFSYSPLVKNAILHLGEFAQKVGKTIQVFDDRRLEQLIFKYLTYSELQIYFSDLPEIQLQVLKPFDTYNSFYKDITTMLSQFSEIENFENENIVTKRKSLNVYELSVVSNSVEEEIEVQINFSEFFDSQNKIIHDFGVINLINLLSKNTFNESGQNKVKSTIYRKRILFGEVLNIRLYIVPLDCGNRYIPEIKISCNNYCTTIKKINYTVQEIDNPPYIGGKLLNSLREIICEADLNTRVLLTFISGEAGVGKSRYSKELIQGLLERNFYVYFIEGRYFINKTFSEFIVEFLTQLYKIPNPNRLFSNENRTQYNMYSNTDKECTLIECFVNDKTLKYNQYKENILKEAESIFLSKKSVFIVDDVQFLDDDSMSFLIDFSELNNQTGRNLITYIFNTELLNFNTKHFNFYHNTINRKTCRHIEIEELSYDSTKLFIDSIIRLKNKMCFSEAFPNVYKLITEHIPLRPFHLLQFIELAKDRNCISLINGDFFVEKMVSLNELLTRPSGYQINVLQERITALTVEERKALYILKILGNIDYLLLEALEIVKKQTIQNLIERKYLRNDNGILTFYHSLTDKFILGYDLLLSEPDKSEMDKLLLSKYLLQQYYPLGLFSIAQEEELFEKALYQLESISQISLRNQIYANALLVFIYKRTDIPASKFIKSVMKIATLASLNDKANFLNILNCLWSHLIDYSPQEDSEAECLIEIIREIGSFYSVFNNFKESIKKLDEGIKRLNELNINNLLKIQLKSRLINRKGVSYKQERQLEKALEFTLEGYKLAIESKSKVMECLSLIDLGYIYMGLANKKNLVLEYWEEVGRLSEKYYDEIYLQDKDTAKASKHIYGLTFGIKQNYKTAILMASEIIRIAQNECSAYYELQGRRAKIFFECLNNPVSNLLEEEINQLIIISSKYNIPKFQIFAYHMLAIYYENISQFELAQKYYSDILNMIFNSSKGFTIKSLEIYLLFKDSVRLFENNNNMSRYPLTITQINHLNEIYADINVYPSLDNCLFSMNGKYMSIP